MFKSLAQFLSTQVDHSHDGTVVCIICSKRVALTDPNLKENKAGDGYSYFYEESCVNTLQPSVAFAGRAWETRQKYLYLGGLP